MRLWRRLRRLWEQSRIRLPQRQLDATCLTAGDRLQIGGELWRIVGECPADGQARIFNLVNHALPSRRAELLTTNRETWRLTEERRALSLSRAEILHFALKPEPW